MNIHSKLYLPGSIESGRFLTVCAVSVCYAQSWHQMQKHTYKGTVSVFRVKFFVDSLTAYSG